MAYTMLGTVKATLLIHVNHILENSGLTEREIHVLKLYYGIPDSSEENRGPMTLEEVGIAMKITRERVRQIRNNAFKKIWGEEVLRTEEALLIHKLLKVFEKD